MGLYTHELEVATALALQVGALLRAEFDRDGGPRGDGDHHADIDAEVELLIRERLLGAFPEDAFRGEETGYLQGGVPVIRCWLVDPNDGTGAFLRGHRGASVSIALIVEGEPVLGVVYAYAAPTHAGDLITWAEHSGPLTRNGRPLPHSAIAAELGARSLVLVSNGADATPGEHWELVAPARFLGMPSIAYRLALVAVGEATATVCLTTPHGWDYAAGHALLRGAGLTLVDEGGADVRYDDDGQSRVRWCAGGPVDVARALMRRPWGSLPRRPFVRAPRDLVALTRGAHVADTACLAHAHATLLAMIVEAGPAPSAARIRVQRALLFARGLVEAGRITEATIAAATDAAANHALPERLGPPVAPAEIEALRDRIVALATTSAVRGDALAKSVESALVVVAERIGEPSGQLTIGLRPLWWADLFALAERLLLLSDDRPSTR